MRLPRRLDTDQLEHWQPRLWARLIGLLLLAAYVIAFVLENRKTVSLHFVLATAHVSLIWLILLSVGIGFVGGVLLSQLVRRRTVRGAGGGRASDRHRLTGDGVSGDPVDGPP